MRYGATDRPRTVDDVASRYRLGPGDPGHLFVHWTRDIRRDVGADARQKIRALREGGSRRAPLSPEQVDARLRITRSRPQYGRDFYLRLVKAIDRSVRFEVPWAKVPYRAGKRPAARTVTETRRTVRGSQPTQPSTKEASE
jgi:hypothetical protein